MIFDDKRKNHWKIFFQDNNRGGDDDKSILNTNRWDVYMNKKKSLKRVGILWKCWVLMRIRLFGK